MTQSTRNILLFVVVFGLILSTGFYRSPDYALRILNLGLISAIMAIGVNMQWGYAGLFNIGIMGFVALGGVMAVLVGMDPVPEAWTAGGPRVFIALIVGAAFIGASVYAWNKLPKGKPRSIALILLLVGGFFIYRGIFDGAVSAIEAVNPALLGYLGGLGWPVLLAWPAGGIAAAAAAWLIGKTALGLRSDYLAIATLGISEIIIAVLKNEEWLSRGVKNVNGIPRPVPYEIDLQEDPGFLQQAANLGLDPVVASTLFVKLLYVLLFGAVLLIVLWLAQMALNSPWGRMMRAIRDNEVAAEAMGKDVTARHLQIFILGSAVCGMAGAMLITQESLFAPTSYQPLRFTFLIWVMVIVGGSGNNFGSVLGGFLIWFLWVEVEPWGLWLMDTITAGMADGYWLKDHLLESAAHMRLLTMGLILILVMRFAPRGLIPER